MDLPALDVITNRPAFLRGLAALAAPIAAAPSISTLAAASSPERGAALTGGDRAILQAAQVAEALAVTTYGHIITTAPLYTRLFPQDQTYIQAAYQEEMAHYQLIHSLTGAPTPYRHFFYPKGMFYAGPVTINTLVTLEEAFIAAYLVGVRDFSTPELRVAAARIMGVESDHRTMARVLAPGLDPRDGGPLRAVTGIKGVAERVNPASNNAYERTLGWTEIDQALAALRPFVDATSAAAAGFDTAKGYVFQPFTPALPTPLGAY